MKETGGAPANVAVAVSKLGGKAFFLGAVGKDSFGFYRRSDWEYSLHDKSLEINEDSIIHFGLDTAFLERKLNETYHKLLEEERKKGAFISFDPNYRDVLITEDIVGDYN